MTEWESQTLDGPNGHLPSVVLGFKCSQSHCTSKEIHVITGDEWFGNKVLKKFVPDGWKIYTPKGLNAMAYCPYHAEGSNYARA